MKVSNMNHQAKALVLVAFLLVLSGTFQCSSSYAYEPHDSKKTQTLSPNQLGSFVFRLSGSVHQGSYTVNMEIGNPPMPYTLDMDTGSYVTWIQCDAPCINCLQAPHRPYKPPRIDAALCQDHMCDFVDHPANYPCRQPNDRCHYEVQYADGALSIGLLVRDSFPLHLTTGFSRPTLIFGDFMFSDSLIFRCGFDQRVPPSTLPNVDGILGLGRSPLTIASQLRAQGLIQNVFGHCIGSRDGYLFFGAHSPSPGTVWMQMAGHHRDDYSPGHGDILFDGKVTPLKQLEVVFDSGSTYTIFAPHAYTATLALVRIKLIISTVRNSLRGTPLREINDDTYLPVCWKGPKRYRVVGEVRNYFKHMALLFSRTNNAQLQLPPEAYLIISPSGNVCFGILNGAHLGLENLNLIGGKICTNISLQDKLVIYDNERELIGWVPSNCNARVAHHPNSSSTLPAESPST
ncbi:unnamed protein product [Ilex paraguariensis]|uniref:Peptidase A1 domain-containing protein n=1 Tax=Ilex paraguariensis TaxID=185542 RepID=A0ABC8TH11_9AQUA